MRSFNMVHCLFEQSGTFRDAFRSFGISAACYDIEDKFGKTDFKLDLFKEIENSYYLSSSIFDSFSSSDLVFAFFPCTHFSKENIPEYHFNPKRDSHRRNYFERIVCRNRKRSLFFERLLQLVYVCEFRNIPLIIENPAFGYLATWFPFDSSFTDLDRSRSGDSFIKPTCYWFFNIKPFRCRNYLLSESVRVKSIPYGLSRSLITSDYALNFVANVVLGVSGKGEFQPDLFD